MDSETYRVTFSGMDEGALKAYLSTLSGVTVGDTEYTKATMWWNPEHNYKADVLDTSGSMSDYDCLKLTKDGFSTSENTQVTIKAEGYDDLTFTVNKDGELVTGGDSGEDSSKLSPPAVSGAQKVAAQIMSQAYTRISFTGDENTVATYLALIETNHVTVNGETIEKISSFWQSEKKFKLSKDPTYGGKNIYLDITEDSFSTSGNSAVVIRVDGYNDLSFTIDAQGNLVTE